MYVIQDLNWPELGEGFPTLAELERSVLDVRWDEALAGDLVAV